MRIKRAFQTVDTHTEGEPTRTIVGGLPVVPGDTMKEKMVYMMENMDWVRKALCFEPRGNDVMSGTVITPPCDKSADVGVLYFEVGGWMPMCGHDTIGVSTTLVEQGLVTVTEPYTYITLDTAAGLVKVKVEVKDGVAKRVTFANAPAFVMEKDVVLKTQEYGDINMNIAYGGNVYGILPSSAVGLKICPENAKEIIKRGLIIKKYLNEQVKVCHPEMPFINKVTHIEFSDEPDAPIENSLHIKNAVVIPPCAIDRSPCGTGTSAKMALLYSQGKLKKGDTFIHESIIGSLFHCQILDEAEVCGIPAIIPEVSGCAYVTGTCTFYIDPDDPFPEGFELN